MIHYYLTFLRDCVYRFLSLGAVVDWNYSYLRYSYFLIN